MKTTWSPEEDRLVTDLIERIEEMQETKSRNEFLNEETTRLTKQLERYKGRRSKKDRELEEELNRHMQKNCPKLAANKYSRYIIDLLAELSEVAKLSPEYLLNAIEDGYPKANEHTT